MTRLIERQKIGRRSPASDAFETAEERPDTRDREMSVVDTQNQHVRSNRRRSAKLRSLLLYVTIASIVVCAAIFAINANSTVRRNAPPDLYLPADNSAEALISEFVYGAHMGGGGDLRAITAESLLLFSPISYTVRRGDTVSEIAANYNIRLDTIISYNSISDVRGIQAGSVLQIPAFEGEQAVDGVVYTVRRGDTLGAIAGKHNVELPPILDANRIESEVIRPGEVLFIPDALMATTELKRALGTLFIRPVVGRLTSPFGSRIDPIQNVKSYHYGVDWANAIGTPVRASNNGTVVTVVSEHRVFGNYIVIDHRDQFQTLYAHLNSTSVRQGQRVEQGAIIGKVGNTGSSTGPHLHFTIYKNQEPVNPFNFIH
jgi:murein DD-endopeptidase MepM/ murein hydrolase activator NlpD